MSQEGPRAHELDLAEKRFAEEFKLLKHFVEIYVAKQNNFKYFFNAVKKGSHVTEKKISDMMHENKTLLDLIDRLIGLDNFEEKVLHLMLSEEHVTHAKIEDVQELTIVEQNLRKIKEFLIGLKRAVELEDNYLHNKFKHGAFSKDSGSKDELMNLLRNESELFNKINLHYLVIIRRIRDYIKNLIEKKPLISVIVPAFNEEKVIKRCLISLHRQTYPNKEVIVVDNRSTDETYKQIAPYTYYYSYTNKAGVYIARNIGAKLAHGDILVFIDADSMASKTLLESVHMAFVEGYNCGKVSNVKPDIGGLRPKLATRFWFTLDKIGQLTKFPAYGAGACLFSDKKLFFEIGGFNNSLKASGDVDLTVKLKKHGKFKYITKDYYYTSMRRFKNRSYLMVHLEDLFVSVFPKKSKREWIR